MSGSGGSRRAERFFSDHEFALSGEVGRDFRLERTPSGGWHARLLLVTRRSSSGHQEPRRSYLVVDLFGELAVHVARSVRVGNRLVVRGHFETAGVEPSEGCPDGIRYIFVGTDVGLSMRWHDALERDQEPLSARDLAERGVPVDALDRESRRGR